MDVRFNSFARQNINFGSKALPVTEVARDVAPKVRGLLLTDPFEDGAGCFKTNADRVASMSMDTLRSSLSAVNKNVKGANIRRELSFAPTKAIIVSILQGLVSDTGVVGEQCRNILNGKIMEELGKRVLKR